MIAIETTADATLALVTRFENGFDTRDVDALAVGPPLAEPDTPLPPA